uniref:MARVEL domain-containing protein n=1 Tax=Panagrolaimus superbus TaxID=310955 RepID=A0A914XZZ5_9BILA
MDKRVEETSIQASFADGNDKSSSQSTVGNGEKNNIPSFDHDSVKYKCCCNLLHVRHGTQIIGFFEILCAFLSFIRYLISSTSSYHIWFFLSELLNFAILVVIVVCLYFAISKQNPFLLLPYLIYQSLTIITYIAYIIFSIIALSVPNGFFANWYYLSFQETKSFESVERYTSL